MKTVFKDHIKTHRPYIGGSTRPAGSEARPLYKLSSNENLLGPSPMALTAIRKQLMELHEYKHQNDLCFREALAESFKQSIKPDQFICANSGMELLDLICRAFLSPGNEAIISSPTFMAYKSFIDVNAAKTIDIPLKKSSYELDIDGILAGMNVNTRLLFISSPNNPVGTIVRKVDMDRLLSKLPAHVVIVYDEVYHDFVNHPDYARAEEYILDGCPVIGLHSFSKALGLAGIRLGYAFSTPLIADYLRHLVRPFMINSLTMAAGMAALNDIDHINRTRLMVNDEKLWLEGEFKKLNIRFVQGHGNFIFFFPDREPESLAGALLKAGIMVRTAEVFGCREGIRVTIGTTEANKAFINALKKIL